MKKFLLSLSTVFILSTNSFGHPPANMTASYDANDKSVTVNLRHRTLDGKSHRISSYEVFVDGKLFAEFPQSSQDSNEPSVILEGLDIPEGSKVKIKAKCSFFGSLEKEFRFLNADLEEENES